MWLSGGTYHAWAGFLDRWVKGDATGIEQLPVVDPAELNAETLVRLSDRILNALSGRLQSWGEGMGRAMAADHDEFSVGRTLTQARAGLQSIQALAGHSSLPKDLRDRLTQVIDDQIDAVQEALENDLARLAASGVSADRIEARRRTLRDNQLTAVLTGKSAARGGSGTGTTAPTGNADWNIDPTAPRRRRVILD